MDPLHVQAVGLTPGAQTVGALLHRGAFINGSSDAGEGSRDALCAEPQQEHGLFVNVAGNTVLSLVAFITTCGLVQTKRGLSAVSCRHKIPYFTIDCVPSLKMWHE